MMKFYDDDLCDMFYMIFHARCISMQMCLNETKHMYAITKGLHMMISMCFLFRCACMLIFPEGCAVLENEYS
jgi:hypothetical protein